MAAIVESSQASIGISDHLRSVHPPVDLSRLLKWLTRLLGSEWPDRGTVSVVLQSDAEMALLNQRFRRKSGSTDVLSFPGEPTEGEVHLGDIAISLETAARQALDTGHSLFNELQVLVLHGVLHCLGYDHERDEGEMEQLERTLRERWITGEPR